MAMAINMWKALAGRDYAGQRWRSHHLLYSTSSSDDNT